MGIHAHFEYQEIDGTYIWEDTIEPTESDVCEFIGYPLTKENLKLVRELLDYDLINLNNSPFVEWIKEKYYEICKNRR